MMTRHLAAVVFLTSASLTSGEGHRYSAAVVSTPHRVALGVLMAIACSAGCGTVDLGDNFVPPDLVLDEDFFYCRIQPEVITPQSCASGAAGDGNACHANRSALRLSSAAESAAPPTCEDGIVVGAVPPEYEANLEAVRFTVQSDPLSSPFYRRPTGLDSHPREIFGEDDECADMIVEWINRGAL